ncbi:MAG: Sodium/glucose cotransporter [Stenotrophomonas maltophilia]|nr:MAG: Sodium/glucose cotransporter [Stenotrophomonas maltophilia]
MILDKSNPYYKDLPGLGVLLGGLWVMNLSYWGFNQYIIQRGLAARSVGEAQKGVLFAAFLKLLLPVIVVVPGIAAVVLAPSLQRPDEAYPSMMALLPPGVLGVVFAALIAAIMASLASKINSVATIFTLDFYTKLGRDCDQATQVRVGRIASVVSVAIAILAARPLLGSFDQAFQYIQDFTGYFTPGITVIFLLGLFWKRANEAGALAAALGSVALSILVRVAWPDYPFMSRVGIVFLAALVLGVLVSLCTRERAAANQIRIDDVSFRTSFGFNLGALVVIAAVAALYSVFW